MTERTLFATITGLKLGARMATEADTAAGYTNAGDVVLFRIDNPEIVVASVSQDDIFDEFGNRFSYAGLPGN